MTHESKIEKAKTMLEQLEEPYRSQAIANFDLEYLCENLIPLHANSCAYVLTCAFDWNKSTEGYDYWLDVYTLVKSREKTI